MKNPPKDKSLVVGGGALWDTSQPQVTYEPGFDPANPPAGWRLIEDNETYTRYEYDCGDYIMQKTEHKGVYDLLEQNRRAYNDSSGRKWGDGDVVGSVPMNLYFGSSGLAEANKNGDRGYQKRWWNDWDNRKWRKRGGDL